MLLDILLKVFGKLAGNGRAWMLQVEPIRSIVKSLLSISEQLKYTLNRLPEQAFPWLCDDAAVPKWEKHFGLDVNYNDPIEVRRQRTIAEYIAIGGQAKEYLEFVLNQSGFDVTITENLSGADLTSEWDTSTLKLANGTLYWYETGGAVTLRDPINKPNTTIRWKKVFIVDVQLEVEQFETFKKILLKYKPEGKVAIIRDLITEKFYYDADLVSDTVDPVIALDADLVTPSQPPVLALDGNLVFL